MGKCCVTLQLMIVGVTIITKIVFFVAVVPYLLRQDLLFQPESTNLKAQTRRFIILGLNGVMSFGCL